ncbi:MAG: VCBS repeat-containing protein [Planctomycetota bacterium]|nr:VCBS repeat-containing protein [Planctomycetota bacterium]
MEESRLTGRRSIVQVSLALLSVFWCAPAYADIRDQCAWTGSSIQPNSNDVMMTPVVVDLNEDGIPDVVFISFVGELDINRGEDGILRAISGDDCRELFSVADVGCQTCADGVSMNLNQTAGIGFLVPGAGVAAGDIDGDGRVEIIALLEDPAAEMSFRLVAFEHDGSFKWCSEAVRSPMHHLTPAALADLDGDGTPEIIAGTKVFNADGTLRWDGGGSPREGRTTTVADLDADGIPEIVTGRQAFRSDGSIFWERADLSDLRTYPAIADFDLDGLPEVLVVIPGLSQMLLLNGQTGATRCLASIPFVDTCFRPRGGGGPPTLADVDGDCIPEIGVAGSSLYSLFEFVPDLTGGTDCLAVRWSNPTRDCSSAQTGSAMFDLEGDGSMEILYNDELHFRIYRASDGAQLVEINNGSGTLIENPTVADVDADGQAEIVICANNYALGSEQGIRILHDPDSP